MIVVVFMREMDFIRGDRRADRRYGLALELRFTYRKRGETWFGSGRTQDISHGGIRFQAADALGQDVEDIELRVAWPFLLQGVIPLELVVRGPVIRHDADGTVLRMRRYEFCTRGEHSFHQACERAGNCSLTG